MQDRFLATLAGIFLWIALFFSGLFFWLTPLALFYIARKYTLKLSMIVWFVATSSILVAYQLIFSHLQSEIPRWLLWLPAMGYRELFGKEIVLSAVLLYSVFFGLVGFLLAVRIGKERRIIPLMLTLVLGSSVAVLLVTLILVQGEFSLFIKGIYQYFLSILDQFVNLNKTAGIEGEEFLFIQQNRALLAGSMLRILPGVLFALAIFLSWLNLVIAKRIFGQWGIFSELQELCTFRLPFFFVWIVIGALSFLLLNSYLIQVEKLEFLFINLFIVFSLLYFFQGLAILSFYLLVKRVAAWIRLFCYAFLLVFIQPFGILLIAAGFFDSWFNFRKLNA